MDVSIKDTGYGRYNKSSGAKKRRPDPDAAIRPIRVMPRSRARREYFFDYTLLMGVLILIFFGMVMLYSASSYEAAMQMGDPSFYLKKQFRNTIAGFVAMFIMAKMDYRRLNDDRLILIGYSISLVLVILVQFFGHESHGAKRWLYLGGISIQPAEVVKLALIVTLACFICKLGPAIQNWKGMGIIAVLGGIPAILIHKITNNFSTAIIVLGIMAVMLFVAHPKYGLFFVIGVIVLIFAYFYVQNIIINGAKNFRELRILAWMDLDSYAADVGFQVLQSLYAIGSGGIWGKGLGNSMQKLDYLPEAQNDMIFSIICEELGIFGAFAVMLVFAVIIWRFMIIADNAEDRFGGMLVTGVMAHVSLQVALNIAVVTNTFPNTGISLPFISYGGSSVMFLMAEIGIVLSVARGIEFRHIDGMP